MKTYAKAVLDAYWSSGKKVLHKGKKYRVGKMSYGEYFFEPGEPKGETEPFNEGTLWLKTVENNPYLYVVQEIV